MIISFFNPSDLIGCGGDINQSDSFRYAEGVRRGVRGGGTRRGVCGGGMRKVVCRGGMRRGYAEGVRRGLYAEGYADGVRGGGMRRGTQRGYALPIATIDLVGDNREFEV